MVFLKLKNCTPTHKNHLKKKKNPHQFGRLKIWFEVGFHKRRIKYHRNSTLQQKKKKKKK